MTVWSVSSVADDDVEGVCDGGAALHGPQNGAVLLVREPRKALHHAGSLLAALGVWEVDVEGEVQVVHSGGAVLDQFVAGGSHRVAGGLGAAGCGGVYIDGRAASHGGQQQFDWTEQPFAMSEMDLRARGISYRVCSGVGAGQLNGTQGGFFFFARAPIMPPAVADF